MIVRIQVLSLDGEQDLNDLGKLFHFMCFNDSKPLSTTVTFEEVNSIHLTCSNLIIRRSQKTFRL